jgi:glycosyltransferase involved in cell wall biosynthesis
MRIAYVLGGFPTVTETFVTGEILELRRRGFPIDLYALRRTESPVEQPEARTLQHDVTYAPALASRAVLTANLSWLRRAPRRYAGALGVLLRGARRNPVYLLKSLYLFPKAVALADLMQRRATGHVHAHWATYPTTLALVVSELTGVRFSFTAHAWDIDVIRTLLPDKVERAAFVVTCTDDNRGTLMRLVPSAAARIHLNYHGVDLERIDRVPRARRHPEDPPLIVGCGALFERKGFDDLVRACGLLKRRGRRFRAVVIGEGPQRPELEALVRAEGVQDALGFPGAVPHPVALERCAGADVFVLPCRPVRVPLVDPVPIHFLRGIEAWFERDAGLIKDGIPNVLVEAMALGVPVVSTVVSGIPELIEHERTGLLVPPGNAVALADALERVLDSPELGRRLAASAMQDVRARFDRRRAIDALVDVFAAHLGSFPSRTVEAEAA